MSSEAVISLKAHRLLRLTVWVLTVGVTLYVYRSFGLYGSQSAAVRALGATFTGASLLFGISSLLAFRTWRRLGTEGTFTGFMRQGRPAIEPSLSAWRWGWTARVAWIIGATCALALFIASRAGWI